MTQRGLAPALFAALTCPIGIPGIDGKEPAVIAAAVVAQLLQVRASWLLARPRLRDMAARARQLDE
jgi:xanthine dehydrogenase accessory factor